MEPFVELGSLLYMRKRAEKIFYHYCVVFFFFFTILHNWLDARSRRNPGNGTRRRRRRWRRRRRKKVKKKVDRSERTFAYAEDAAARVLRYVTSSSHYWLPLFTIATILISYFHAAPYNIRILSPRVHRTYEFKNLYSNNPLSVHHYFPGAHNTAAGTYGQEGTYLIYFHVFVYAHKHSRA